jgi:hypothetical protein
VAPLASPWPHRSNLVIRHVGNVLSEGVGIGRSDGCVEPVGGDCAGNFLSTPLERHLKGLGKGVRRRLLQIAEFED